MDRQSETFDAIDDRRRRHCRDDEKGPQNKSKAMYELFLTNLVVFAYDVSCVDSTPSRHRLASHNDDDGDGTLLVHSLSTTMSTRNAAKRSSPSAEDPWDTNYGSTDAQEQRLTSPYQLHGSSPGGDGIHRSAAPDAAEASDSDDDSLDEEYEMSLTELLYSSASYHAIVKPGERLKTTKRNL
jgi:hypothetical protein